MSGWAWGSLYYDTGYAAYENPYYVVEPTTIIDNSVNYAQPIETAPAVAEEEAPAAMPDDAATAFDAAQSSFYEGKYSQALTQVEKALVKVPQDTALHEFRALCLFALKRYKDSAGNLYAVLSVAPGWDWTTMSGLYPSVDTYTAQLRELESYVRANVNAADGHFVLAYHYMTAGHNEAAAKQLEQVVKLTPRDQVSKQLLAMVTFDPDKEPATPPASEAPAGAAPKSVVGSWKAPSGSGSVDMVLKADGTFTWTHAPGGKAAGKPKQFTGKYELAGNTLVLDYATGGSMAAKVSEPAAGKLKFQMVGGPPNDPGLVFSK